MFHTNTYVGRVVSFLVLLLLSLTAIAVGLLAFNYDFLNSNLVQANLRSLVKPAQIAIGVAGVLGLLSLLGLTGSMTDKCSYCRQCKSCESSNHGHTTNR